MDYASMSLVELKQLAKGRGYIKMYYVMPKHELVRILSMPNVPREMMLSKLTIKDLREEAKARGMHGFWTLSRSALLALLYPPLNETAPNKKEEDERNANKHDDPESHDSQ
jgi:hypothetical protein